MTYEVKVHTSSNKIIHIMIRDITLNFTNSLTFYEKNGNYLTRYSYCKKKIVNYLVTFGYITIVEISQTCFVEDILFANYILQLTSKALLEVI